MRNSGVMGAVRVFARTLLLAYLAAACTVYKPSTAPVAETLATPVPEARVTVRNRGVVELRDVRVIGDSLVGFVRGPSTRFAVETSAVDAVEVKSLSGPRTVLLTVGIAAGVLVALGVAAAATLPPSY
ncbi:MAG: hypothetical protein ABIV10_06325 [Gemmatimonadaceae bacterium]